MSRISVDHSHPRPCYGKKSFRGCRNSMDKENTILIDVDSDYFDNVIIIDVPDSESFPKRFKGPSISRKDKTHSFTNVINIDDDDDDDDDETADNKRSGDGVKKSSFCAEASSSRNFSLAGDAATDEHQFVQENVTPVRLSKCKRTYSGKAFTTNHYGLDTDSETESDASDSDDFPDCELMVDSSGRLQKQWEKAFFTRWKDMNKGDFGAGNSCSTSQGINGNQAQHFGTEGETRCTKKVPFSSSTKKSESSNGYEAPSSSMNVDTEADACPRSDCQDKDSPFIHTKLDEQKDYEPESSKRNMDAEQETYHQEQSEAEEVFRTSPTSTGTATPTFKASATLGLKTASPDLKATTSPDLKATASPSFTGTTFTATATPSFTATATHASSATTTHPLRATMRKCQNSFESVVDSGSSFLKEDNLKNFQEGTTRTDNKNDKFNRPRVSEIPLPDHIPLNEAELRQDDSVQSSEKEGGKDERCQNEDDLPSVESCVISEREKLKETDEYKRAMEEEWASRQQALQIQAEEAQRLKQLRKRKKAESLRLSDMKRRQKKRLEEIRTSQKKDEENMNLKDVIRAEVRKDLQKLELSCKNMPSLLHHLGVSMTGWPNPLPQEVQVAYKKALLTFHPDRASQSDIRKQVEAEEKFKLVNRLKEKFSPSL